MQAYGRVEEPLASFCGDNDVPLHFVTRKHFYEQMKARQNVPVNEMARLGIDIVASLSTYHIDPVGARDFFLQNIQICSGACLVCYLVGMGVLSQEVN